MSMRTMVFVAALAGVAVGAAGVQLLHAQVKPPAYVVGEIDIADPEAFEKAYVPNAAKAVRDGGGKYLVVGGRSVGLYGEPPKRIAIMAFESLDKAEAAFASPAYKAAKREGDKYARFRIYAVEGLPQ